MINCSLFVSSKRGKWWPRSQAMQKCNCMTDSTNRVLFSLSLSFHRETWVRAQYLDLLPWSSARETKKRCGV
jgi:hypothetical protein